ncbi:MULTISPECIES: peroxiredoxin [unclassified Cryobacterium]|uniref:peroxiredoxin n=1 Tax=unclassified Cryobacterium TaxID=2649013 RepID=UPI000CE2E51C|nr:MULTISPECIES: peroxiredoxin [unclassified Cryobacterium]
MTNILPTPIDDGAGDHLFGLHLPDVALASTSGGQVSITNISTGRWIMFIYPRTGVPGQEEPIGWADIPGAKGCTAEACSFRDSLVELQEAGAHSVIGLSVQSSAYQREAVKRLHLPYPLLSDQQGRLAETLNLPTFAVAGLTLLKRMTLVIDGETIRHVFYPVFPAEDHADQVRDWLHANPAV